LRFEGDSYSGNTSKATLFDKKENLLWQKDLGEKIHARVFVFSEDESIIGIWNIWGQI